MRVSVVEYGRRHSLAQHLKEKYSHVSFSFLSQRSRFSAQNHLVEKTVANFLAYVDGETVLDKDWATHCVAAIKGQAIAASCGPVDGMKDGPCLELKTSAMLLKRDCLKKIGLFRPMFKSWQGVDLAQSLLSRGFHLALAPLAKSSGASFPFPFGHYGKLLWFILRSYARQSQNWTKALSWEGRIYVLNPALSLCLGERDIVAVDMASHKSFTLEGYQDQTLRDFLYQGVIAPTSQGPLRFLTERKILIEIVV